MEYYLKDTYVSVDETVPDIINHLDNRGFVVIPNFEADKKDGEQFRRSFLELCEAIGDPIAHDASGSIIWDIKSNPKSQSFIKTYSEHSHEAELHTDSQYSYYPEDYFALLTLKQASCGGGISYILTLEDVLSDFRNEPINIENERILRETNFPFVVPNVFSRNSTDEREYNFGPILKENEIRFRIDTFEKAIKERPEFCTKDQLRAYNALKNTVLNSQKIRKFYLKENDLIFINNKTVLHGRSAFTDPERHLLRIRMNKKGAVTTPLS